MIMTAETDEDLDEVVFTFLSGLPDTIRDDVLMFVLLYAFDSISDGKVDNISELTKHLATPDTMRRFGATVRTVMVTDFVLRRISRTISDPKAREKFADDITKDAPELLHIFQKVSLRQPMRDRHFVDSLVSWNTLRASQLSHQSLMDFENRCLCPQDRG